MRVPWLRSFYIIHFLIFIYMRFRRKFGKRRGSRFHGKRRGRGGKKLRGGFGRHTMSRGGTRL